MSKFSRTPDFFRFLVVIFFFTSGLANQIIATLTTPKCLKFRKAILLKEHEAVAKSFAMAYIGFCLD